MRRPADVGAMAVVIAAALLPGAPRSEPPNPAETCAISLSAVAHPLRFEDFPAAPSESTRPARPRLDSAQARLLRTMLREGAARGPNFAGHFTFVGWGCGTSCTELAIVDARTGRVFFDPLLDTVSTVHVDSEPNQPDPEYWAGRFRLDSRLLVVLGAPNEDETREGAAFYEWTGSALKLLRFVPAKQACRSQQ